MLTGLLAAYSFLDLKVPPTYAYLNDAGVVAGKMYADKGQPCFIYKDGKTQQLSPDIEEIKGINSRGQLAVQTKERFGVWTDGKVELVDKKFQYAAFAGIDDKARMVGYAGAGSEGYYYVVYSWLPNEEHSFGPRAPRPEAIAPDGSFVGTYSVGMAVSPPRRASGYLRKEGVDIPIGDVDRQAFPTCISLNHHVGGKFSHKGRLHEQPFIWFDGKFEALPIPVQNDESYGQVVAVNDAGEAVGDAHWRYKVGEETRYGDEHMYWKNGKYTLLRDMLPKEADVDIIHVFGINNKGQILVHVQSKKEQWKRTLAILSPKP